MTEESQYPLVTFALFAYNQEQYIREAVGAALKQDYPNLEIIISDDASDDGTWRAIEDSLTGYFGPHRIVLNRNAKNLGIGSHVSFIGHLSRGELIVLAAGDDVSEPGRVKVLVDTWVSAGRGPAVLYSDVTPIDRHSQEIKEWGEKIFAESMKMKDMASGVVRILGASTAYTSSVFSEFDDISRHVFHEDRVLPFRALLLGGKAIYVDCKLVQYRVEGGISRNFPRTRFDYLSNVASIESRGLKDATQRLADLMRVPSHWDSIGGACVQSIATHFASWDLAQAKGFGRELATIRGILSGARKSVILKLYLKFRLNSWFGFGT